MNVDEFLLNNQHVCPMHDLLVGRNYKVLEVHASASIPCIVYNAPITVCHDSCDVFVFADGEAYVYDTLDNHYTADNLLDLMVLLARVQGV